jgi:negative regulator of sigma E activity
MADAHPQANQPLDADDPRISEWIDGRLAPSEAAAIERAVAETPELTLLVEDLRAIRAAMRHPLAEGPKVDLGDRIMAAIASSRGSEPRVAAASREAAPTNGGARRLPWLGLLGALAAGLLVTVVINFPNDNGREVALGPGANKAIVGVARPGAERESVAESKAKGSAVAKEATDRLAVAADQVVAQGGGGEEVFRDERLRDKGLLGAVPREAPPIDGLAAETSSPQPARGRSIEGRADTADDESISMFANRQGGSPPKFSAAPAAPPPAPTVPIPATEPAQLTQSAARSLAKQEDAAAPAPQVAKRVKVDLAGVLVIAITNASERRALDRLVAESGLEATPEKDHLALVGKATDVDAFLQELARVGLVSAVPGRRAAQAGKLEAAEKRDARNTTLILRVVERKGKQPASVQAGEAETKP